MSRPLGGYIGHRPVPAAAAGNSAAGGMWTLREAQRLKQAGTWPTLSAVLPTISGLQLWLDAADANTLYNATTGGSLVAADGGVARWEDKSGNGRHFTQAQPAQRPARKLAIQGGLDALSFDGSDDTLSRAASIFSNRTAVSWFAVVKNDDSAAVNRIAFSERVSAGDAGFLFGKIVTTNILFSRGSSDGNTRQDVSEATAFPTTALVASMVTSQSLGTARRNGVSAGTNSVTLSSISYQSQTLIGSNMQENGLPLLFWDGLWCEFIVYDTALSDTDRAAVESYLMSKWGIT